jgi:hypothetical protein
MGAGEGLAGSVRRADAAAGALPPAASTRHGSGEAGTAVGSFVKPAAFHAPARAGLSHADVRTEAPLLALIDGQL